MGVLGQLMRSLHRYSSDVAMLFALFHGIKTIAERKVGGSRWLPFLSGLILVGALWLVGWTGYWLVWDVGAQKVAVSTAELVDLLPVFPDPLSRSFLTDDAVNSLLFFIVFFIHMLIPVAFGIFLWVHIQRVSRSRFFTGRVLTIWLVGTLLVISTLFPALSGAPADMARIPEGLEGDWWYLGPMAVIDRLGAGPIWTIFGITTVILFSVPWWAPKQRVKPTVIDASRCNGCQQCVRDCPFNAIDLIPDDGEGRESPFHARVNPTRCVGCGTCVGSCDSSAIDAPRLPVLDARRFVNAISKAEGESESMVAFLCGASGAADFKVGPDGSCPELPGYRVIPVICTGWVHMLTVERAIRRGAAGVLIAGCGQDAPCRESVLWTAQRLSGDRGPELRTDHVDPGRILHLSAGPGGKYRLIEQAAAFRRRCLDSGGRTTAGVSEMMERPSQSRRAVAGIMLASVLSALVVLPSHLNLLLPKVEGSRLVVSFKVSGQILETTEVVADEDALPHMRRARPKSRERSPVRMSVLVDGQNVSDESYQPGGIFNDGESVAIAEFALDPGTHHVEVRIADTLGSEWPFVFDADVTFDELHRRVLLFDSVSGFKLY
ncbi:MAG: 4Fe-4S binding protein, partial [Bacteroidota bacterium]|nr:4Fe-4S binding protein [Bacteroidota bacterium]